MSKLASYTHRLALNVHGFASFFFEIHHVIPWLLDVMILDPAFL